VLRNDGLGVGEAVVVTELMVGQLVTREARWTAGRTRVMPSV
jgi:hypothetical protein